MAIGSYALHLGSGIEAASLDQRFRLRGVEQKAGSPIVVIGIDSATLTRIDKYPLPRRLHAQMISRLRRDGAKQISYDVQFTEETDPRDDNALIESVAKTPHVVLATTEVAPGGRTHVFGGGSVVKDIGAVVGYSQFPRAASGEFRRMDYEKRGVKTFAVATVEASGLSVSRESFPGGSAWINYAGPAGTFPTYSFAKVLAGEVAAAAFRGKIVIVGATADSLQDVHPTPFDSGMPGPEIQANAVATVAAGNPLRSSSAVVDILAILALTSIAACGFAWRPLRWALAIAVALGGLYLVGAQLLFNAGVIVPVFYPTLGLILAAVGGLGLKYIFSTYDKQRARDEFARFVPEPIVDRLLAEGNTFRLGGESADATVLFADLRGFTSFAESRDPASVVEHLNRYFSVMTKIIMRYEGTLVSFMGDGIMAVFGAPLPQKDHADRAFAAACDMVVDGLPEFNSSLNADPFQIGIGLNSGAVLSGTVGSSTRTEYTAIGDTTNTASRLESMTKGSGYQVFIADSTRSRLSNGQKERLTYVDEFEVRGRDSLVRVWSFTESRLR